jgi:ABC-type dipeptide/oligopeptide/nickel transport system permease component
MQRFVLKDYPHYHDENACEIEGIEVPEDKNLRKPMFQRILDSLLDGGRTGVDVGLAIIPGVLIISTLVMVAISVPSFVVAFLLQSLLYYRLGVLPPLMAPTDRWFSGEMLLSLVMPVTALSLGTLAGFTRITRAELTETLTGDYMLLARAKGLTKLQATVRHAFKNSAVVVLPAVLGSFVGILSGSMIIERIFSIPGVGELYLGAILSQDYNFFMMLSAFYTFVGLSAGLIVDLSYGLIDPRVRIGQR